MRRVLPPICAVICVLLLFLLALRPQEAQGPKQKATVHFWIGSQKVQSETVWKGDYPQEPVDVPEGLTFAGWKNADGNVVDPYEEPVQGETNYYAQVYPILSKHVPYLFADADGALRPEEPLSGADLTKALNALAAEGTGRYFPDLSKLSEKLGSEELTGSLAFFFPAEQVRAAFPNASEEVSRLDFARGMNILLGRSASEKVAGEVVLPPDLGGDPMLWGDFLEAALAHTHGEDGKTMLHMALETLCDERGFLTVDGWLYCLGADGALVHDADVGALHFGPDCLYTSGDTELDALVAQILDGIIQDNPELTGLDLLRKAFEYSRDSFMYLRKPPMEFGATGWEVERAKQMFQTGRGNCYNYAASFWALARGLGYDAVAISGTMTKTEQPHSWVEIPWEGEMRICDPETEMAYRVNRNIFDKDMFFLTYSTGRFWNYKRP